MVKEEKTMTRMRDLRDYLVDVAERTGYAYEFLADEVAELVRDGCRYDEAVDEVVETALEFDY